MAISGYRNLLLFTIVFLLIVVALLWIFFYDSSLYLIVLFDDVGRLQIDAPVVWKNFTIGKVTEVRPLVDNQVGVTVRIKEEYGSQITRGSEFYLKRSLLLGLLGEDSIEVITPAAPGDAFVGGEKVQGKVYPSVLEEGVKRGQEYWRQLKEQTSRLIEEFQKSSYRKELEEALAELRDLADRAAQQTMEKLEEFRKRHADDIERIRRKLEGLRDKMRRQGDEEGARRIEKQLEKMKSP